MSKEEPSEGTKDLSISAILCSHARLSNCTLEWRGAPIEMEDVFDESHLLPAITMVASIKGVALMKWNLDVRNEESKEGLLGMRSVIPMFKRNMVEDTMRGLFFIHAAEKVFGLSRGGVIECVPVYEFFKLNVEERAKMASKVTNPLAKITLRSSPK